MAAQAEIAPCPRRGRSLSPNRIYARSLMRAFGGAILFAFPLLMTMEMWALGFYIDRARLFLFVALHLAMLCLLAWFTGFEETDDPLDAILDALAAFGVGAAASALMLAFFGVLTPETPWDEAIGKVALQTAPAAFGAVLANKQLGAGDERAQDEKEARAGYLGQLFLMLAGALFLAYNVAPTQEMVLIAYMIGPWRAIGLALFTLAALHVIVYNAGFAGEEPRGGGFIRSFAVYSLVGYAIALGVSLYVLWTFGRTEGLALGEVAATTVVLAFPAGLGAALARLVV